MMMSRRLPIASGLFTDGPSGPRLLGSRCTSCGQYYFPASLSCRNPSCNDHRIEQVELSSRGRLWSFTVQHYPPPSPFRSDLPFRPFAIGLVELDGLKVLGMIQVADTSALRIGSEMEVNVDLMYTDEEGNERVTWKFKPTGNGARNSMP